MKLLIVIVNWRTGGLTIDCLRSLSSEINPADTRVVVTDNASGDGSPEQIEAAIRSNGWSWASVKRLARNGGFAYGNNGAIGEDGKLAVPEPFVLLLNPDTVVQSDGIRALVGFMEANPAVGIAGSRLEDPDGTPQISAFRFPSICSELERGFRLGLVTWLLRRYVVAQPVPNATVECDWVSGASFLIRREVLEKIGLLDDGYFMYFEEVDFALRARRAGFSCWYVPESRVVHLIGAASGISDSRLKQKRRPTYWFDSRRRYFSKNHGWLYTAAADVAFAIGYITFRFRQRLQRKEDRDPPRFLRDSIRNSVFIKGAE